MNSLPWTIKTTTTRSTEARVNVGGHWWTVYLHGQREQSIMVSSGVGVVGGTWGGLYWSWYAVPDSLGHDADPTGGIWGSSEVSGPYPGFQTVKEAINDANQTFEDKARARMARWPSLDKEVIDNA